MPSKNVVKNYGPDQFYHVYSRGVDKQSIFRDNDDRTFFLSLFARYLSTKPMLSAKREPYPHYGTSLELNAFCLMNNHIHLLVFQKDDGSLPGFMRAVLTSYSGYFNRKYGRVGPLFQSRYLASMIDRESYLEHISRYIHLNPKDWQNYLYSSYPYYLRQKNAEWLKPQRILSMFDNSSVAYTRFLQDYSDHKKMLDELKLELAHD